MVWRCGRGWQCELLGWPSHPSRTACDVRGSPSKAFGVCWNLICKRSKKTINNQISFRLLLWLSISSYSLLLLPSWVVGCCHWGSAALFGDPMPPGDLGDLSYLKVIDELARTFPNLLRYFQLHPTSKQDISLHASSMTEFWCKFATYLVLAAHPEGPHHRIHRHRVPRVSCGLPRMDIKICKCYPTICTTQAARNIVGQRAG